MLPTTNLTSLIMISLLTRSLASMELLLIISSTVWRYDIKPVTPGKALDTAEGFLRKPTAFDVKMRQRVHD